MAESIQSIIDRLVREWSSPRTAAHYKSTALPLLFSCSAVAADGRALPDGLPAAFVEFWKSFASARLFEDREYGQWGLELFDQRSSDQETQNFKQSRSADYRTGDRVIGQFFGDSDLLLLRCDSSETDYGQVLVALPIDPRAEWYQVGDSFDKFLSMYAAEEGAKFWEPQPQ